MDKEKMIGLLEKNVVFWDNEGEGRIAELPRANYDQLLALLKGQLLASEYPDSEFTKVQRKAAQLASDAYEEDQEWCPTKISRLLDACRRLDASTTSQKDLLVACKIGLNGLKAVLQIAMEFEAKGEVFTEENKNKHKDNIETVEAAIAKAQPKKVEDKENDKQRSD